MKEPADPFNDGGPVSFGLTVRDYFAAKAMEGMLANPQITAAKVDDAYEIADAMLAERKKPKPA